MNEYGYEKLWGYFGLSRASWLTMPRVMMHDMSDEWQSKMADLLNEWDNTWINQPCIGTRVQITDSSGKLIKTPNYIMNYRHPDKETIKSFRGDQNDNR